MLREFTLKWRAAIGDEIDWSWLGATNEDLADLFEVSLATIGNWLAKHPEFKKAVQEAATSPTLTWPCRSCRRPRASPIGSCDSARGRAGEG